MCVNVFSVLMSLSAYIMRAIDKHFIKKQLTYLSAVYVLTYRAYSSVKNFVKITQGIRPCGAFISWNWVKFLFFGLSSPPCTDWVKIWREELGRLLHAKFNPSQNCFLSKLGVCAARILPATKKYTKKPTGDMSRVQPDHPRCRNSAWSCMYGHTHDLVTSFLSKSVYGFWSLWSRNLAIPVTLTVGFYNSL